MSTLESKRARRPLPYLAVAALAAIAAPAFGGCGSPPVILPEGAWSVVFTQPDPTKCQIAPENNSIGTVTADAATAVFEPGELVQQGNENSAVDLSCTVYSTGSTFYVEAYMSAVESLLNVRVDEMSPKATKDNPSKGTIQYRSHHTADSFSQSDCIFYFSAGTKQTVAAGYVWVTFECPAIAAGSDNICSINTGYAYFKKCTSASEG